jgi:RES domain-containing protein
MVSVWRIVKRKHATAAFSGEGARRYGGRWNSAGVPIIYTAESQSLAALEMVVHLDSSDLLDSYVVFKVEIDESLVANLKPAQLPRNWRAEPPPMRVQEIGDAWVAAGHSAALQVPSAILPAEHNCLLNPRHPDFLRFVTGKASPFRFDPRLAH